MKFVLLISLLLLAIFSTSFGLVAYGDKLLKQEQLGKAETVYGIAKLTTPFHKTINQRLEVVKVQQAHEQANSEESMELAQMVSESNSSQVLGARVSVPVLMYHYIRVNPDPSNRIGSILSVTPDNFGQQMDYLASHGYNTISPDDLVAALNQNAALPTKPVLITFDDGYEDLYLSAYPILKSHGFKAVSFIITDFVERPLYLKWQQIDDMKNGGLITFGSHTVNHQPLAKLDSNRLEHEVAESRAVLTGKLGYPINWISYPFGSVNDIVVDKVRQAGYAGAFGTNGGKFISPTQEYTIPRTLVSGYDTMATFAAKLP